MEKELVLIASGKKKKEEVLMKILKIYSSKFKSFVENVIVH
jgi:hypothetical protein